MIDITNKKIEKLIDDECDKKAIKLLREYEESLREEGAEAKNEKGEYKSFNDIAEEAAEGDEELCTILIDMLRSTLNVGNPQYDFMTNTWTDEDFKKELKVEVKREWIARGL